MPWARCQRLLFVWSRLVSRTTVEIFTLEGLKRDPDRGFEPITSWEAVAGIQVGTHVTDIQ